MKAVLLDEKSNINTFFLYRQFALNKQWIKVRTQISGSFK
jgi:hypothetical protein